MTLERWASLWSLLLTTAAAFWLFRIAEDPTATRTGRFLIGALDSWVLSARWSAPAKARIRPMAYLMVLLAALSLYKFIFDPEPRYPR